MLSVIADALMVASRQDTHRWPDRDLRHPDRFVSDHDRRETLRQSRYNLYSFFH